LSRDIFTSSNIFLLLGVTLFVIAIVSFPTRVEFVDQQEPSHSETYTIGWLFAPIIGAWGFASLALGLEQSSMPKRRVEYCLLFILAVVCVGLSFATYMVVFFGSGIVASAGRGEPFFWLYFGLILAPNIIVIASTTQFLRAKERAFLKLSRKVKTAVFVVLAAVPLTYSLAILAHISRLWHG